MEENKSVFLSVLYYTFYIRIIALMIVNIYLVYYLITLFVSGNSSFAYKLSIPFLFIILFTLLLSYVSYVNSYYIKFKIKKTKSKLFTYHIFEGLALILTAFNLHIILLYIGIIDLIIALILKNKKYEKYFKNKSLKS
jgi:hypothetical protein